MGKIIQIFSAWYFAMVALESSTAGKSEIEGLPKDTPYGYSLTLEVYGNISYHKQILVNLVNRLSVVKYFPFIKEEFEELLSTEITDDEYDEIYQRAYEAIGNFRFSSEPHNVADATHYKLALTINKRTISISYISVRDLRATSEEIYQLLLIVDRYMPDELKFINPP